MMNEVCRRKLEQPREQRGRERVASGGVRTDSERSDTGTQRGASPSAQTERQWHVA
jgi:hypothetical protein